MNELILIFLFWVLCEAWPLLIRIFREIDQRMILIACTKHMDPEWKARAYGGLKKHLPCIDDPR